MVSARPRRMFVTGMLSAVTLAACTSSTPSAHSPTTSQSTQAVPLLARGEEATKAAVPWSRVGPGWMLADWTPTPGFGAGGAPSGGAQPDVLYLVNPKGGRYLLASPSPGSLLDWSGDGRRALFASLPSSGQNQQTSLVELDLRTGSSHTITIGDGLTATFTKPKGLALLLSGSGSLERIGLTGTLQQTYPASFPGVGATAFSAVESPDGTQLVLGAKMGLALVSNDATVIRELPVPSVNQGCEPVRWWSRGVVLASCFLTESTLWLVPTSGAAPSALTSAPVPPDFADENAWQVGGATYVQDAGACGYQYLAKLNPNSTTTPVGVPGVDTGNSVFVVGAHDNQLALRATVACGTGVSLLWFDPVANTTTVLLGPPVDGGGVSDAILYPQPGY